MPNETAKTGDSLSWRRTEHNSSDLHESSAPRGASRGRGQGRGGGRGSLRANDGAPGRPEPRPRSGRRRGAPKPVELASASPALAKTVDGLDPNGSVAESRLPPKSPQDVRTSSKDEHHSPLHSGRPLGVVGIVNNSKLNGLGPSAISTNASGLPAPDGTKKNGFQKSSSRNSHRRTRSAAFLKPSSQIVSEKNVHSAANSPITPVKDLPPHLTPIASTRSSTPVSIREHEQLIAHVAQEQSHPTTPSVLEGHIDWAQDDDDEELPDLDDWGITTVKPAEEISTDIPSRSAAESTTTALESGSSSPGKESDGNDAPDAKPSAPSTPVEAHHNGERRRTRGSHRDRGTAKLKNALATGNHPSTAPDLDSFEAPLLLNGQKRALVDRIGPTTSLSVPPTSGSATDSGVPKSPGLPHHPSLPAKPCASPFATSFNQSSLSVKPMSEWRRPASRPHSPCKESSEERPTSTLDSIYAPENVRAAASKADSVESGPTKDIDRDSVPARAALDVKSLFQGNSRFNETSQHGLPSDVPRRPRRDRSPIRSQRGPRNNSSFNSQPNGSISNSRSPRSRQTNAARPVISMDALQRISRSLKGSPTPPRHASPAPSAIAKTAAAAAAE